MCVCVFFVFGDATTNHGLEWIWLAWTYFLIWSLVAGRGCALLWFALACAPLPSRCLAGIGKLSTADGKAFADPEVLRRLTSSVSCALDEAAAALTRMRAENTLNAGQADKYVSQLGTQWMPDNYNRIQGPDFSECFFFITHRKSVLSCILYSPCVLHPHRSWASHNFFLPAFYYCRASRIHI